MLILGASDHVNCGSALVEDGKLISAINDERLVREKMVFGVPRESIKSILKMHAISPSEIGAIAVATKNQHFVDEYLDFREGWFGLKRGKYKQILFEIASGMSKYRTHLPFLDSSYYLIRRPSFSKRRRELKRLFREEFGFSCPVRFLDHHFCHAASAYYTSGYDKATVVSIDGGGDGKSCRIYDVDYGQFKEMASASSFDSLGNLYAYITQLCGFKAGRDEGKITGLAAYGNAIYVPELKKILIQENGHIRNIANVFFFSALKELEKLFPGDFYHRDLAASIQHYSEQIVMTLIRKWLEKTKHYNVALAGGLFANVRINQRVHEIPEVKSIFIHPAMSDEGLPAGAALALYNDLSGGKFGPGFVAMEHAFLGPEFNDEEIRLELKNQEIKATLYKDVEQEIANLLAGGFVVARFNGKMEYGPRALGNRSILYKATDPTVNYWLNESLKRTEFMPFAPIVMAEHASKCFKDIDGAENTARFMTITFDCTEWMVKNNPGVVHVDNTARPQLIRESDNPSMYRILAEYYKLTGSPCLINTSFNIHEEPIVCKPYDAIRAFKMGNLDYLAIGNWIAKNANPLKRKVNQAKFESYMNSRGIKEAFNRTYT